MADQKNQHKGSAAQRQNKILQEALAALRSETGAPAPDASAVSTEPPVWVVQPPTTPEPTTGTFAHMGFPGTRGSLTTTTADAANKTFAELDLSAKRMWAKWLYAAGYLSSAPDQSPVMAVEQAYATLVQDAQVRAGYGLKQTPLDVLEQAIRWHMESLGIQPPHDVLSNVNVLLKAAEKEATKPHTSTSYDVFNADAAHGLLQQTLQQALGRDPTQAEYEDFLSAANARARANPTTTVSQTNAKGDTSSHTVEGFDSASMNEMAQQFAQDRPDYGTYQSVGTYFPAAMAALGAVVG